METRWLLADVGQPDPTFGENGVAVTGFAGQGAYGTEVAVTSEGKPIIATAQEASGSEFATGLNLARLNIDGSLDTSFGVQGKTSIAISRFLIGDAAVQSDGKLLVAGTVADPNYPTSPTDVLRFIVLRFNTDGSLDSSFGTGGSVRTAFTSIDPTFSAEARHIAVSPSGTIAVGGHTSRNVEAGDRVGMAVAVYDSSGQLLMSFSDDGIVTHIVTDPEWEELHGLGFQPDGKLLVSDHNFDPAGATFIGRLRRYNVDGTLDSSFGSNGIVQSVAGNPQLLLASQILVTPDNKILLGAGNQLKVQRLNANGSLDTTFGGGDSIAEPAGEVAGVSYGMLRLSDGRIRVAGPTWVQYRADGTPDSSFGARTTRFPSLASVTPGEPGAFDPDGKLIVAARYPVSGGDGDSQFAVVRVGRNDVAPGNDGTLWVDGTGGDDTITISPLNGSARLVRNGVTTDFDRPVTSIQLNLSSGNDLGTVSLDVPASVQGGSGNDSITTAGGNDTIIDSSGDDTLITGDGDDSVTDTNGSNSITTGAGNDLVVLCVATWELNPEIPPVVTSAIATTVATGDGDDMVVAGGDVVASLGDGNDTFRPPDNLDARPGERFNVDGGNGDDHLSGSPSADSIVGGAGNDTIQGDHGDDAIDSGDGDDHVEAGFGHDTIHGGSGADRIHAGYGNNLVFAGDGDDYIQSGTGNDTLWGEIGYDTIKAGFGDDYLNGGAGKDRLFGQQGDDVVYAGRNNDALDGGPGRDLLKAGEGNDKLWDRDGHVDRFAGGAGADQALCDDDEDLLIEIETVLG